MEASLLVVGCHAEQLALGARPCGRLADPPNEARNAVGEVIEWRGLHRRVHAAALVVLDRRVTDLDGPERALPGLIAAEQREEDGLDPVRLLDGECLARPDLELDPRG